MEEFLGESWWEIEQLLLLLENAYRCTITNKRMSISETHYIGALCLKILSKLNLNNQKTKDSVITCKSFTQIFILDCRTVLRHIQNSCSGCYFAYSDKLYWSQRALCTHKDWLKAVKGHWSFVFNFKPQRTWFILLNFNSGIFFHFQLKQRQQLEKTQLPKTSYLFFIPQTDA